MINERFTTLLAVINTGDPVVLDVQKVVTTVSIAGDTTIDYLYPQQIQLINDSGAGIEWLSVSNEEEYAEYVADPSSFTFIRLPAGYILQDHFSSFPRCYKFIFQAYETVATSSLITEFINYI